MCDSAHGVYIIGGFHSPDLVGDLGDDIIGPPCEYPVDHAHSMVLILVLGRTIRSSIIQASSSIDSPNPMTIITVAVSWCEGMYPIPDQAAVLVIIKRADDRSHVRPGAHPCIVYTEG